MKTTLLGLLFCFWSTTLLGQTKVNPLNTSDIRNYQTAEDQIFQQTHDRRLGYVPVERLEKAIAYAEKMTEEAQTPILKQMPFNGYKWIEIGPTNVSGRTRCLLINKFSTNKKEAWAGAIGGGLWKTEDIKAPTPVWYKVKNLQFDDQTPSSINLAVTAIAMHPTNQNKIYFGTGAGPGSMNVIRGRGVWKTANKGVTWQRINNVTTALGANLVQHAFDAVQKIVVNPNGDILVATANAGILKLTDAGVTNTAISWTQAFGGAAGDPLNEVADIEVGSSDGTILYAAVGFLTGPGRIFRSINSGSTWVEVTGAGNGTNLPIIGTKRIELACAPSDANVVYAMVANATGALQGIYKSSNAIANASQVTWSNCNLPTAYLDCDGNLITDIATGQAWSAMAIAVDPNNAARLVIGAFDLFRSSNSGNNWERISDSFSSPSNCTLPYVHFDQHLLLYEPNSSSNIYVGNDGGIYRSNQINQVTLPAFSQINTFYNNSQFYSIATKPTANNYYLLGGTQDNRSRKLNPSTTNNPSCFANSIPIGGGDGGMCFIDNTPSTSAQQIVTGIHNTLFYSTDDGSTFMPITSDATGLFINPMDYDNSSDILYSGHNIGQLLRWKLIYTGEPQKDVLSATLFSNEVVTCIKVSPSNPTTIFVGTNEGGIFRITDANSLSTGVIPASKITDISPYPLTINGSVSSIEIDPNNANKIAVTFSNYDMELKHIIYTYDGGTNWKLIQGNLPEMPVWWATFAPTTNNTHNIKLLLATEAGVWATTSSLPTAAAPNPNIVWEPLNNRMATTRVRMLKIRSSDGMLFAATFGRGIFRSDIFSPIKIDFTCSNCPSSLCYGNSISLQASVTVPAGSNYTQFWDLNFDGNVDATNVSSAGGCHYGNTIQYCITLNNNTTCIARRLHDIVPIIADYCIITCAENKTEETETLAIPKTAALRCIPNPNQGELDVELELPQTTNAKILFYDLSGHILLSESIPLSEGKHILHYDLSAWADGLYLLQIVTPEQTFYSKIIKAQ